MKNLKKRKNNKARIRGQRSVLMEKLNKNLLSMDFKLNLRKMVYI